MVLSRKVRKRTKRRVARARDGARPPGRLSPGLDGGAEVRTPLMEHAPDHHCPLNPSPDRARTRMYPPNGQPRSYRIRYPKGTAPIETSELTGLAGLEPGTD